MKDFCVDHKGVSCPMKNAGALKCANYVDCKYIENRTYFHESEIVAMESESDDNYEKNLLRRFIDLEEDEKRKEISFYKKIIELYEYK